MMASLLHRLAIILFQDKSIGGFFFAIFARSVVFGFFWFCFAYFYVLGEGLFVCLKGFGVGRFIFKNKSSICMFWFIGVGV